MPMVNRRLNANRIAVHAALMFYTLIAIFPIALVLVNAFKSRAAIFGNPLALPTAETFSLIGFQQVLEKAEFGIYFGNSLIVTVVSLVLVLLAGAMAAWA